MRLGQGLVGLGLAVLLGGSVSMHSVAPLATSSATGSVATQIYGLQTAQARLEPQRGAVHGLARMVEERDGVLSVELALSGLNPHHHYRAYISFGMVHQFAGYAFKLNLPNRPIGASVAAATVLPGVWRILENGWFVEILDESEQPTMAGMIGMGMPKMSMMDGGHRVNHHLEVHIFSRTHGSVVTSEVPEIWIAHSGMHFGPMMSGVVGMYSSVTGMADFHYGNNVYLAPGMYTVKVRVGGETALFTNVHVSDSSSGSAMGSMGAMGS